MISFHPEGLSPQSLMNSKWSPPSLDGGRLNHLANTFRNLQRLGEIRVGQDQGKLLASEPPDQVRFPNLLFHLLADGSEHLISHKVAVTIIHLLEVIHIQHHHGKVSLCTDGLLE